jgi:hypothetical protein
MTALRPGKRARATAAPSGNPSAAATATALRLTVSDTATICRSSGSAEETRLAAVSSASTQELCKNIQGRASPVIPANHCN